MNNAPPIILDAADPCSPLAVPPSKTALLLLDFHSFIVASQPDAGKDVVTLAAQLRSWARTKGMFIVHCGIDFRAVTPANRKMAKRANGVQQRMTQGPQGGLEAQKGIASPEVLAPAPGEYLFYRPPSNVSALGSYGLEAFLAAHCIESLVLTGFSTSMCVLNTAKDAADSGFVVTVIRDATGDKDAVVHDTILNKVVVGQVHVSAREEYMAAWEAKEDQDTSAVASQLARTKVVD
ncbi:hypothetical protein SEUCBS139899_010887 [Sporothrix eucalyptigena]|uniref:Isochorismatase-like domain-containing protein n=1 Tax=Sporothrix eucalyptigena TaxID=1812306 RepID=A0ABP0CGT8_9PEZI